MKPLDIIYTIRAFLGALTAVICLLLGIQDLITAIGIAVLIYFASDRILRQIFIEKLEKSEVTKTGVGIFIITWLFLDYAIYVYKELYRLA
ncbi:hypothetical protein CW704_06115 [Candidatus Bathyarchaeota archaeon]|nr:MAG: hypothetical protein CW704_06115 [Candidatus Bathyarchaeota archaeon]